MNKSKLWKWCAVGLIVALLLCCLIELTLILFRNADVARETYMETTYIPHMKWKYELYPPSPVILTDESGAEKGVIYGLFLIDDWEEYQEFCDQIDQTCLSYAQSTGETYSVIRSRVVVGGNNPGDAFRYSFNIDKSLFQTHKLVVVDICREAYSLWTELTGVDDEDDCATITIYKDYSTGGFGGQEPYRVGSVYWIPVSRDCTEAELRLREGHWLEDDDIFMVDTAEPPWWQKVIYTLLDWWG